MVPNGATGVVPAASDLNEIARRLAAVAKPITCQLPSCAAYIALRARLYRCALTHEVRRGRSLGRLTSSVARLRSLLP